MLVGLFSHYFFGIGIFLTSMFLVMLVLVQRGRGGGIAGALGGAGGQSAFGTKAGDLFTRITVGVATFWILLCCAAILTLKERGFSTGIEKQQAQSGAASSGAGAAEKAGDAGNTGEADAASGSQESSPPATVPSGDSANPSSGSADPATSSQLPAATDTGDGPVATEPPTDGVSPEVNELDSDSAVSTPDE